MTGSFRGVAAAFNAIVMVSASYAVAPPFPFRAAEQYAVVWGPATAAVIAALVVLTDAAAPLGWMAIGYLVFAWSLGSPAPLIPPLLLLLALAFLPLLPRPGRSLPLGLLIATVTAVALILAFDRFIR